MFQLSPGQSVKTRKMSSSNVLALFGSLRCKTNIKFYMNTGLKVESLDFLEERKSQLRTVFFWYPEYQIIN